MTTVWLWASGLPWWAALATLLIVLLNTPTTPAWGGWLHTVVGGGLMAGLMLARHQLLWWPLHPVGYPIGAVWLIGFVTGMTDNGMFWI